MAIYLAANDNNKIYTLKEIELVDPLRLRLDAFDYLFPKIE